MKDKEITLGLRLGSMLLDHVTMCLIIVPPLILLKILLMPQKGFGGHPLETPAFYFMMLVYFNKDFVNSRSIAKRILGLVVVDRETGEPASELKCLLRNFTIAIWPLEVLISLFSRTRRLGDVIANTKIEVAEKESPGSILTELKSKRLTTLTFWTLLVGAAYLAGLWYLMDRIVWA